MRKKFKFIYVSRLSSGMTASTMRVHSAVRKNAHSAWSSASKYELSLNLCPLTGKIINRYMYSFWIWLISRSAMMGAVTADVLDTRDGRTATGGILHTGDGTETGGILRTGDGRSRDRRGTLYQRWLEQCFIPDMVRWVYYRSVYQRFFHEEISQVVGGFNEWSSHWSCVGVVVFIRGKLEVYVYKGDGPKIHVS